MVEKVDRYRAKDGREFLCEESAHRHEAVEGMIAAIPELALIRPRLEAHMNAICQPVAKLARFLAENHPESSGETTLEPEALRAPKPRVVINVETPAFATPPEKAMGIRRG